MYYNSHLSVGTGSTGNKTSGIQNQNQNQMNNQAQSQNYNHLNHNQQQQLIDLTTVNDDFIKLEGEKFSQWRWEVERAGMCIAFLSDSHHLSP